MISQQNLDVLEHVFKRPMASVAKITITAENLGKVMDAVRMDERADALANTLDAALNTLKGK